jgi:energy-coupling factor transporter ATP-binding protein EcfA2
VDARAAPFLERLGLTRALDTPVATWSSGMRQTLSLGRALLMSPQVLLLDEPTSNLDPVSSRAIHDAVRAEADRGVAVVLATHDLASAQGICDRVAFIDGTILALDRLPRQDAPPSASLYDRYAALFADSTGPAEVPLRAPATARGATAPGRILRIARREWLEQGRQPAMLSVIAALFLAIALLVVTALVLLDLVAASDDLTAALASWMPAVGMDGYAAVEALAGSVVGASNWLLFTQFLGITAVQAGHTVLHDRQCGALPFLLLAPIRRIELLFGKVLGAMGPPTALYLLLSGAASALAASLDVTAAHADRLPPAPAWFVAFFLGGPIWGAFIATLCAIVSGLAEDVRTAQQGVWFLMFFATFACGFLLAGLLPQGPAVQAAVALLGLAATTGAQLVGSRMLSRDLGR